MTSGSGARVDLFIPGEFAYNSWDELANFTGETTSYSYRYDPESLRTKKTGPVGTTRYHYDLRNRAAVGRFISEDMYAGNITYPLTLNLYTYVTNNPLKYWDPSGYAMAGDDKLGLTAKDQHKIDVLGQIWEIANRWDNTKLMQEMHDAANNIRLKYTDPVIRIDFETGTTSTILNVTTKINELLEMKEEIYKDIKSFSDPINLLVFYQLVRNKGKLDFKNNPNWQSDYFIYDGEIVDKDVPGNIAYGYMGKVFGFPDIILFMGAGYAQVKAGTTLKEWQNLQYFGDDPRDRARIEQGINLYNKKHPKK